MENEIHKTLSHVKKRSNFIDLINTNYTIPEFLYPSDILIELASKYFTQRYYAPEPKGLRSARESISQYLSCKFDFTGDIENIFITASTSESYLSIFQQLKKSDKYVLLPKPIYPLFEYVADYSEVKIKYYSLDPENNWQPNIQELESIIDNQVAAIVLITPNNPTGSILSQENFVKIQKFAERYNAAIIVDSVFDIFNYSSKHIISPADICADIQIYWLNGISKMFALPDLKLAWIYAQNCPETTIDALETHNDTYLNANYLTQSILPSLFEKSYDFQSLMISNLKKNIEIYSKVFKNSKIKYSEPSGGIHCIIRILNETNEEEFVLASLLEKSLNIHPGYFYDFPGKDRTFVLSLLNSAEKIEEGAKRLLAISQEL